MNTRSKQPLSLQLQLDSATVPGAEELYELRDNDKVQCHACGHHCVIFPDQRGICQVRTNIQGKLYVPYGYVAGVQSDPVEKKPFFHAMPGSNALTFGMLGCDFHCSYCQNWITSQALRDNTAGVTPKAITPDDLIEAARETGARLVVSSYNEPLITAEWSVDVFKKAREAGLITGFVSNGNGTPQALDFLQPYTDCYKVDLKSFRQTNYRALGGQLKHILWTIEQLYRRGFWLEVLTLVIPGFNDSSEELGDIARFIAGISPEIPWHVTAFRKNYKMTNPDNTTATGLMRAAEIGREAGLHYVYAGNRPGEVSPFENTVCPGCGQTLIERFGYVILSYHLTSEGQCPTCKHNIPGLWPKSPGSVRIGSPEDIFRRRPIRPGI
jgi:pyruvate formate lyase activating enzyme